MKSNTLRSVKIPLTTTGRGRHNILGLLLLLLHLLRTCIQREKPLMCRLLESHAASFCFFLGGLKSLESNSRPRRKLLGATHDDARAQRITDPLTVKATRQTSISTIPSTERLSFFAQLFCTFQDFAFCPPGGATLKTILGVCARRCANAATCFCRIEETQELQQRKNVSGNKSRGLVQAPCSVTERDRKIQKERSGTSVPPSAEMRSALPAASVYSPNMVDVSPWTLLNWWPPNKLLRSDKMFAGLMGLECHTKPLPHRCEGKHGCLCPLFWLTCEHILCAWKHKRVAYLCLFVYLYIHLCFGLFLGRGTRELKTKRSSWKHIKPTSCVCTARVVLCVCVWGHDRVVLQSRAPHKGGIKSKPELQVNCCKDLPVALPACLYSPALVCSLWDVCLWGLHAPK